jgi:hypothetical protein
MFETNSIIAFLSIPIVIAVSFLYYLLSKTAIESAINEHQENKRGFSRWVLVVIVLFALGIYVVRVKPFSESQWAISQWAIQTNPEISIAALLGLIYVAIEIPYQLVKTAAKDAAEELLAAGDDRRNLARMKSAQTLATIIARKLKVSCELQAFTSNEEFVFLTYIVDNKPVATRLKLNQADKADNWKKLGEWIMSNYQKENPQQ